MDLAVRMEGLPPAAKSVLVHVAQPACKYCGLSWPGVWWLEQKTGLKRTAVKEALDWLIREGHLRVHAYPKGGRGRTTEYVVLPQVIELPTPRCAECIENQKTGRLATGIDTAGTGKGVATRPVSQKPVATGGINRSPGDPQSVIESNQSVGSASNPVVENSPDGSPPANSDPPPTTAAEALARVREMTG